MTARKTARLIGVFCLSSAAGFLLAAPLLHTVLLMLQGVGPFGAYVVFVTGSTLYVLFRGAQP